MKRIYAILCLFIVLLQAQDNNTLSIDGFVSPQAIVATSNNVFVSNMGNNTGLTKNGNGFVSKLDKNGVVIDMQFISNLNSPSEMEIFDNILYIIDINRIKAFNIATKKQILNLPINSANKLSDIAINDYSHLFVADGEAGLILLIDLKKNSYYTFVAIDNTLGTLQNIALDNKFLYVSTFDSKNTKGYILKIDIETKEISILHRFFQKICGFQLTKNGGIIIATTGKNNEVKFYKIAKNSKFYIIDIDQNIKSVAKFFIDKYSIWIPDTLDNKVKKITPTQ